jgi:hypothetical protein
LGRKLSANDVKVILYSQILVELSAGREAGPFLDDFNDLSQSSEEKIKTLLEIQNDL